MIYILRGLRRMRPTEAHCPASAAWDFAKQLSRSYCTWRLCLEQCAFMRQKELKGVVSRLLIAEHTKDHIRRTMTHVDAVRLPASLRALSAFEYRCA